MDSHIDNRGHDLLDDFECSEFGHADLSYDVYRSGSGPAVIVMPEIPGITPPVADFARLVRDRGLSVHVPSLFGTPGKPRSVGYLLNSFTRACVAGEFAAFATNRAAPVTLWLTELARQAHKTCGGPGVGTVGMCLTGSFALAMATDPSVIAPVASQPVLPVPISPSRARSTGLCGDDEQRVALRTRNEGLCALGLRFNGDPLVPARRFAALSALLGDNFTTIELDSRGGSHADNSRLAHSALTEDLRSDPAHPTQQALRQVLDFLTERLLPEAGG